MQPTDFQAFKLIMAGMGRVFSADTDGVMLDAYWLALKSWPLDEFEAAAAHLLANSQFMPKPADFNQLRKTAGEHSAGEAWAKVLHTIRTMNPWEAMPSVDPKTDAVVCQLGGYRALAMTKSDDMHWREKRFAELWEDAGEVVEARKALPATAARLTGPQSFATLLPSLVRQ
jgi:hypothetical protein